MYPLLVPFRKPEKAQKPINKDEYKTVTLKIDPADEAKDSPTIDKKVWLFADGTVEDWLRWRMEWEDVVRDKPLKTGTQHQRTQICEFAEKKIGFFPYPVETIHANTGIL